MRHRCRGRSGRSSQQPHPAAQTRLPAGGSAFCHRSSCSRPPPALPNAAHAFTIKTWRVQPKLSSRHAAAGTASAPTPARAPHY